MQLDPIDPQLNRPGLPGGDGGPPPPPGGEGRLLPVPSGTRMMTARLLTFIPSSLLLLLLGLGMVIAATAPPPTPPAGSPAYTTSYQLGAAVGPIILMLIVAATVRGGAKGFLNRGERIGLLVLTGLLVSCVGFGAIAGLAGSATGPVSARQIVVAIISAVYLVLGVLMLVGISMMPSSRLLKQPNAEVAPPRVLRPLGWGIIGVAAMTVLGSFGVRASVQPAPTSPATTPAPVRTTPSGVTVPDLVQFEDGADVEFREFNFALSRPSSPWVDFRGMPDAAVGFQRRRPEVVATVIAEVGASGGPEVIADAVEANFRAGAESVRRILRSPATLAGYPAIRVRSEGRISGLDILYETVATEINGFSYQLIVFGNRSDAPRLREVSDEFVAEFRLLDPERRADPVGVAALVPIDRPDLGLEQPGTPDAQWSALSADVFGIDLDWIAMGDGQTTVGVTGVRLDGSLDGLEFTLEEALQSFAWDFEVELDASVAPLDPAEAVDDVLLAGSDRAVRFTTERIVDGSRWSEHFDLLRRGERVLFRHISWPPGDDVAEAASTALLGTFVWSEPGPAVDGHAARQARLAADIAEVRSRNGRPDRALEAAVRAAQAAPDQVEFAVDEAWLHVELSRFDDAAAAITRIAGVRPDDPDAHEAVAWLMREIGRTAVATEAWARAFELGLRNDEALASWVDDLIASGAVGTTDGQDAARSAIDRFAIAPDGTDILMARARILESEGRTDEARATIAERLARPPYDPVAGGRLVSMAYDHGAWHDVIDAANALITNDGDGALTWYLKAIAEVELGRLDDAIASIDRAIEIDPGSERLADARQWILRSRGESDTSAIARVIEPVPLPAGFTPGPLDEAWLDAARASHGAAEEWMLTSIAFEPGERLRTTRRVRSRVLAERGRDRLGTRLLGFDAGFERLHVNSVVVTDPDGTSREIPASELLLRAVEDDGTPGDDFEVTIPISGLRAGSVIDAMWTRESLSAPDRLPYDRYGLASTLPMGTAAVTIDTDAPLDVIAYNGAVEVDSVAGTRIWRADRSDALIVERSSPPLGTWMPGLAVSGAGATWADEGREYLGDIADRLVPTEDVAAIVTRETAGLDDPRDIVSALARFVQSELRYRAVAIGPRAWRPEPVDVVLSRREGDCKDHSVLLHLLLREAGIESRLGLVRLEEPMEPSLVDSAQADHMIVAVTGLGEDVFIDATDKYVDPLSPVPYFLDDTVVLRLDPDEPRLVRTPAFSAPGERLDVTRRVEIEGDDLTVRERIEFGGFGGGPIRHWLADIDSERRPAALDSFLAGLVDHPIDDVAVTATGLDDPRETVTLELEYRVRGAIDDAGDRRVFDLPAPWATFMLEVPHSDERRTAYRQPIPTAIAVETTVELPSGVSIVGPASSERFDGPLWTGSSATALDSEQGRFGVRFSAESIAGLVPADRYSVMEANTRAAIDALRGPFVLE